LILAEGHIHGPASDNVNMAVGQKRPDDTVVLGRCPRLRWEQAFGQPCADCQTRNVEVGAPEQPLLSGPHTPLKFFHFDPAAHDQRRPLMDGIGLDVQNPPLSVRGRATGLFRQESHGVGFVQQAELALRAVCRGWVQEDAPFE
jgi:hypothetical protein